MKIEIEATPKSWQILYPPNCGQPRAQITYNFQVDDEFAHIMNRRIDELESQLERKEQ